MFLQLYYSCNIIPNDFAYTTNRFVITTDDFTNPTEDLKGTTGERKNTTGYPKLIQTQRKGTTNQRMCPSGDWGNPTDQSLLMQCLPLKLQYDAKGPSNNLLLLHIYPKGSSTVLLGTTEQWKGTTGERLCITNVRKNTTTDWVNTTGSPLGSSKHRGNTSELLLCLSKGPKGLTGNRSFTQNSTIISTGRSPPFARLY